MVLRVCSLVNGIPCSRIIIVFYWTVKHDMKNVQLCCLCRPGRSKFREAWLRDILASKAAVLDSIQAWLRKEPLNGPARVWLWCTHILHTTGGDVYYMHTNGLPLHRHIPLHDWRVAEQHFHAHKAVATMNTIGWSYQKLVCSLKFF